MVNNGHIFSHYSKYIVSILIIDLLFPETKGKPLLNKKRLIFWGIAFLINLILLTTVVIILAKNFDNPYIVNPLSLAVCVAIIVSLILLAYKYRNSRYNTTKSKIKSPTAFFIFALIFQHVNLFLPHILKGVGLSVNYTIIMQIGFIIFVLAFVFKQVINELITIKH